MTFGEMVYNLEYEMARDNLMFMSGEIKIALIRHQHKTAIRTKRRGLLSSSVCLQHDNARPHRTCHTVKQRQNLTFRNLASHI